MDLGGSSTRTLSTAGLFLSAGADESLGSVAVTGAQTAVLGLDGLVDGDALTWYAVATDSAGNLSGRSGLGSFDVRIDEEPTPGPSEEPSPEPTQEPTTGPTAEPTQPAGDLYSTPGFHNVNGRWWYTGCEPYSQTQRCRTEIWGTQIQATDSGYEQVTGWVFNNLTYLPSERSLWTDNPLGGNGVYGADVRWPDSDGREWRTECDTATTGRNGCRTYTMATVLEQVDGQVRQTQKWVFNNLVRFN